MSQQINKYANSLYNIAKQEKCVEKYNHQLKKIDYLYKKIPVFRLVLISKRIDNNNKINILKDTLKKTIDAVIVELLSILIQKDLIQELPNIIKRYNHIAASESTVQSIDVMVAHDLNENEKNNITQKLLNQFNNNPNINIIQDSQLVGGIKLKIGNKVFDNSISNQLKQLKRALHNM